MSNLTPLESFQNAVVARRIVAKLTISKIQAQLKDLEKNYDLMQGLLRKVENAEPSATKKQEILTSKILYQAGHSYGYATKLGEALLEAGKENLL